MMLSVAPANVGLWWFHYQLPHLAHILLLCHSLYDFVCRLYVERFHHIHATILSNHEHQNSSSHPGPGPWASSNAQPVATSGSLHPCDRLRLLFWCPQGMTFAHTRTQHKMNAAAHCNHKTAVVAWCITSNAPTIWIGQMPVMGQISAWIWHSVCNFDVERLHMVRTAICSNRLHSQRALIWSHVP